MQCPYMMPIPPQIPEQTLEDASRVYDVMMRCLELFVDKNIDYGSSWKACGLPGVLVRLSDKIQRALNLSKNGTELRVKTEGLKDTLMDAINYLAMAVVLLETDAQRENEDTQHPAEVLGGF